MRNARESSPAQTATADRAHPSPSESAQLDPLVELQQSAGNQAMLRLLAGGGIRRKPKVSEPGDESEKQADLIAARVTGNPSGATVQRKCAMCAAGAPCSECAGKEEEQVQFKRSDLTVQRAAREGTPDSEPATQNENSPAAKKTGPALIVEDDAKDLSPGQMRKTEFISQLRTAACSAAEQALAGTMWSAMGCPYITRWMDHYSKRPSTHLERALRKYVPESANVRSAQEYLPLVTQKLKLGIEHWRSTGETPEMPEALGAGPEMPGMTVGGLVGGLLSAAGSAISGAVKGLGRMLFKHKDGQEAGGEAEDPATIRSELGAGHALEGGVKQRMQSAFGADFSGVRVHSDSGANEASDRLNARAFTIGSDIAFGPGEYQPGTPVGDALIAHELAHVQQQSAGAVGAPMTKGGTHSSALEEDADMAAVGAVASTFPGATGLLGNLGAQAVPRLRSGLRLQRCSDDKKAATAPPAYTKAALKAKVDGGASETALITYIKGLKPDEQKQALKDLEALRIDYVDSGGDDAKISAMEKALQNLYREVGQTQAPGKLSPERGYAATGTAVPPELLTGTKTLTSAEKTEATGVLTVTPSTGPLPEFKPVIGPDNYEVRIKARVKDWIDGMTAQLVTGKGVTEHGDASKVFPMSRFAELGNAAREEADKTFGSYARGPAFTAGVNLKDRFVEEKTSQAALGPLGKKRQARDLVAYILTSDEGILTINREHGAVPSRTTPPPTGGDPEATILTRVKDAFAASHRDKLLKIDRGWEATQGEGKVSVQRFKKGSDDENRKMFWDYFQIMLHEYMHSLENADYHAYANTFGYGTEQYDALVEGMASVLAEIAWTNVKPHVAEQSLRDKVEGTALSGAAFNPANVPEMNQRRYASFDQAMKLVNKVGIRNVYAAFFLGKVELIGKP
jgi:uncharacterized protein DUF4157